MKIRSLQKKDLDQIVQIHLKSLPGDFLPSLGSNFLKVLYKAILNNKDNFGAVVEEVSIKGFVLGTKDMKILLKRAIRENFIPLSYYLLLETFKKPEIFKNIIQTFFYSSKDKGVSPELVIIAVKRESQGKGYGKMLIQEIEKEFLKRKITEYKLTVHADKKAVYFYENLGYDRFSSFKLYGKEWYLYGKKINKR